MLTSLKGHGLGGAKYASISHGDKQLGWFSVENTQIPSIISYDNIFPEKTR